VRTGLTRQQIYDLLLRLSKQHIIDYIPRKKTPYITYKCKRVETDRLQISRDIYEKRKELYKKRIEAVIEYATCHTACRSRMLLRYFDEKNDHECGQCDVCLSRQTEGKELTQSAFDALKEVILQTLSRQSLSSVEIARQIEGMDREVLGNALQYLIDEGELTVKEGMVSISSDA
jgi:ATP-dependent DNA helicase RecQ